MNRSPVIKGVSRAIPTRTKSKKSRRRPVESVFPGLRRTETYIERSKGTWRRLAQFELPQLFGEEKEKCGITASNGFPLKAWKFLCRDYFSKIRDDELPPGWVGFRAEVSIIRPDLFETLVKNLYRNSAHFPANVPKQIPDPNQFGEEVVVSEDERFDHEKPRSKITFKINVRRSVGCGIHMFGAEGDTFLECLWFVSHESGGRWYVTIGRIGCAWTVASNQAQKVKERKLQELLRMRLRIAFPKLDEAIGLGLTGVLEGCEEVRLPRFAAEGCGKDRKLLVTLAGKDLLCLAQTLKRSAKKYVISVNRERKSPQHCARAMGIKADGGFSTFELVRGRLHKVKPFWRQTEDHLAGVTGVITIASTSSAKKDGSHDFRALKRMVRQVERRQEAGRKGRALEALVCALLGAIPGFSIRSNMRSQTEEVDLLVLNANDDCRWRSGSPLILIECKNWSSSCGKNELVQFQAKIENRRGQCRLGFLISWNGFANTVSKEILRGSRGDTVVALLSGTEIKAAAKTRGLLPYLRAAWDAAVIE